MRPPQDPCSREAVHSGRQSPYLPLAIVTMGGAWMSLMRRFFLQPALTRAHLLIVVAAGTLAAVAGAPVDADALVTHRANSCNLSNSGSVSVSAPAGLVAGDVLVASAVSNDGGTISPPSGWTSLQSDQPDAASWYKVAGGGEPGSYGFTSSASDTLGVSISAFAGADTSAPIAGSAKSSGTVTSVPLPNASVSRNGSMRWSAVNASPSNAANITFDGGMTRSCWRGGDDAALATAHESASVAITATRTATLGSPDDNWAYTAVVNAALPEIASIAPASGPAAGGQTVTITGEHLTGTTGVTFGGTAGTSVTVLNDTTVTVTTPARAAGTVDVRVIAPPGTSVDAGAADDYTFVAPPTVTGLSPTAGPTAGGTSVTITGTDFVGLSGAAAVRFGATNATSYTVDSATQITATAPPGTGTQAVTVTTPGGTSADTAADDYTYHAPPTITNLSPDEGPTAGGTVVTITGTNFGGLSGPAAVRFGATNATGYTVLNATTIAATAPAGTGTQQVSVVTPGGTTANTAADDYTYVPVPTVTNVSPGAGPAAGGTSLTVTGTNLTGATSVTVGGAAASFSVDSATQITATTPAGAAGTADVRVTTAGGQSANTAADDFTYVAAPAVTSLAPSAGPAAGGTSVTITGTNLTAASAVTFGGVNAAAYTVDGPTQITATAPAGAGVVDVRVTTIGGQSADTAADDYTFVAAPTVSGLAPSNGPIDGGTSVVITGTNLSGASAVTFGGVSATGFTVDGPTQITATAPAGSVGSVAVLVTTVGGTSADTAADDYTYDDPCAGGALEATWPDFAFDPVNLNGLDVTRVEEVPVGVTDLSGLGAGWKVQVGVERFGTGGGAQLPADAARITGVTVVSPDADCVAPANSVVGYPLTLPIDPGKVTVFNAAAGTGEGETGLDVDVELDVPASAAAGTYTSTWTVDLTAAP